MNKTRLLTIAILALLAINISILAFLFFGRPPQPSHRGPAAGQGGPSRVIIDKLHFDEKQVARYEVLIEQHQAGVKPLNEEIMKIKSKLYATLADETATGQDSLINRLGGLQMQMENVHYDHFLEIKKLCTPEQLAYFNSLSGELAKYFTTTNPPQRPRPRP
jgi:periplasmic protein CpxP/Spy